MVNINRVIKPTSCIGIILEVFIIWKKKLLAWFYAFPFSKIQDLAEVDTLREVEKSFRFFISSSSHLLGQELQKKIVVKMAQIFDLLPFFLSVVVHLSFGLWQNPKQKNENMFEFNKMGDDLTPSISSCCMGGPSKRVSQQTAGNLIKKKVFQRNYYNS